MHINTYTHIHTCNVWVLVVHSKYDEMLKWWNLVAGIYLLFSSNISVCRDISIRKLWGEVSGLP